MKSAEIEIRRVLVEIDVEAFMKKTDCTDPKVALIAIHKCRAESRLLISRKLRRESQKWLMKNGYSAFIRPRGAVL